jgi:hypothetical protein
MRRSHRRQTLSRAARLAATLGYFSKPIINPEVCAPPSNIQVREVQRVGLDELAARLDDLAHEVEKISSASSTWLTFTWSRERAWGGRA